MITYSTNLNTLGPYTDDSGNPYWIINGTKTYYNPGPYTNTNPGTVPTKAPINQITTPITPKTEITDTGTAITPTTNTTAQPATTTNSNTMLYLAIGVLAVIFLMKKMK